MPITTECPACGKRLKAPDTAAGKRAKCPDCGGAVPVPAPIEELDDDLLVFDVDDDEFEDEPPDRPQRKRRDSGELDGPSQRRPCPMCGEAIAAAARKCRFCGETLVGTNSTRRGDVSMGTVRTGIAIIYYGLMALLACAILFAVSTYAMRGPGRFGEPGGVAKTIATVFGVGALCGIVAMIVGKFICLGVPRAVGTAWMIYVSCGIDILGIVVQVLKFTVGLPTALSLFAGVLSLAGTMIFLFFLKSLGDYIRSDKIRRLAGVVIIMTAVTIGAYLLFAAIAFGVVAAGRPGAGVGVFMGVMGFILFIIAVVTLCLYGRLLTYLKDAL